MDANQPAKAPAKTRGLKPHQIMMLLLGALAVFMIVGGVFSLLEESRLPAAPGQAAS
jgi:hypothetical protein